MAHGHFTKKYHDKFLSAQRGDSGPKIAFNIKNGFSTFVVEGTQTGIIEWLYENRKMEVQNYENMNVHLAIRKQSESGGAMWAKQIGGVFLSGAGVVRGVASVASLAAGTGSSAASGAITSAGTNYHLAGRVAETTISSRGRGYTSVDRFFDKAGLRSKYYLYLSLNGTYSSNAIDFGCGHERQFLLHRVWSTVSKDTLVWP